MASVTGTAICGTKPSFKLGFANDGFGRKRSSLMTPSSMPENMADCGSGGSEKQERSFPSACNTQLFE